jgi:hypothetical protein
MKKPPAPKLTPRERRHAKQVKLLERWHKKVEQAINTLAKSKTVIPRLEKQLERYDRGMLSNAPLGKPEPVLETPARPNEREVLEAPEAPEDIPEFLRRDKPKRKRKPKGDALGLMT